MLCQFQYISCYSLSKEVINMKKTLSRFNTSHVTLYPKRNNFKSVLDRVSIHLMLLFIWKQSLHTMEFQCFNTSHVTLYRTGNARTNITKQFQYISCYSLSLGYNEINANCVQFQYISCYSLSKQFGFWTVLKKGFQYISCYSLSSNAKGNHSL